MEFFINRPEVRTHGGHVDIKLVAYFFIKKPFGQQCQHFLFTAAIKFLFPGATRPRIVK